VVDLRTLAPLDKATLLGSVRKTGKAIVVYEDNRTYGAGAEIVTVEGMMRDGKPHPLQKTFAALGATQCGYCIPGVLLTAKSLLDKNPHPSRDEIRQALSGNLCRCTGYTKILQAVELAAKGEEAT